MASAQQADESTSFEDENSALYLTCQFLSEPNLKSSTEHFFSISKPFQILYSIFLLQDIVYINESKEFVKRQSKKKAHKGKHNLVKNSLTMIHVLMIRCLGFILAVSLFCIPFFNWAKFYLHSSIQPANRPLNHLPPNSRDCATFIKNCPNSYYSQHL